MINYEELNTYLFNEAREIAIGLNVPIVVPGADNPKADAFVKYSTLLAAPKVARPEQTRLLLHVELMCYHVHANAVSKGVVGRIFGHLWLAQKFVHLYHQRRLLINNTCLQFTEARMIPMDLKSVGQFSQAGNQASSPLNLNVAVIESFATINQGNPA